LLAGVFSKKGVVPNTTIADTTALPSRTVVIEKYGESSMQDVLVANPEDMIPH
jgi:hypothetical protein